MKRVGPVRGGENRVGWQLGCSAFTGETGLDGRSGGGTKGGGGLPTPVVAAAAVMATAQVVAAEGPPGGGDVAAVAPRAHSTLKFP